MIWFLPLKPMESLRTICFSSSSSTHSLETLRTGLSSYHQDLLHPGLTSRPHFLLNYYIFQLPFIKVYVLIYYGFYHFQTMVYDIFIVYYMYLEYIL